MQPGRCSFSGAPAASGYELIVTATIAGNTYSTAQTYAATGANPNPILAPFAVLEADISTLTMQIGELSDMDIVAYSAKSEVIEKETFMDTSGIASSSTAVVSGGVLQLANTAGLYASAGSARLNTLTPSALEAWELISIAGQRDSNTDYKVRVYSSTSTPTLIPESDLPGNSAGFSSNVIDISSLDVSEYPAIAVEIELSTSNTSVTPSVTQVYTFYRESTTAFGSQTLAVRGDKTIGTDSGGNPIYKYSQSLTTDSSGEISIAALEFGSYTITPPGGYIIREACSSHPVSHQAGVDSSVSLLIGTAFSNSLRVSVVDTSGNPVPGAMVEFARSGFSDTKDATSCGQAFFSSGVGPHEDYVLTVTHEGYVTETLTNVSIAGNMAVQVTLTSS